MATARKVPGNENVSTYGTSRNYTALSTWEAAKDNDLVTATAGETLEVYADAEWDDGGVSIQGATTNSTYFRVIRSASGEHQKGIPSADGSVYTLFAYTTNANLIATDTTTETFCQLQDFTARLNINSGSNRTTLNMTQASSAAVGVLIADAAQAGAGTARGIVCNGTPNYVILCLAHNGADRGILLFAGNGESHYAYNCTATDNGNNGFFESFIGTATVNNCLAGGNTGSEFSGTFSGDYNMSDDTSAPGANAQKSVSATFVNTAIDDYHLQSGSNGAGQGNTLAADGNYAFDTDIDDVTITSWPIGFDEPTAAVTAINSRSNPLGVNVGMARRMTG